MTFSEDFSLSTLLCDEDDKLTIWGLARLFQKAACDHSDTLGIGFEGLKPINKAWVLTRVYYNILRFPSAGETLTLRTWPKPDNGLIAPRDYQLIDSEGNICATSASNWVIIDMLSRRVIRLKDIMNNFDTDDCNATKYNRLEKMIMPSDMELLKHIDIPYSAIDHTRHVNNAEYMKWISDSIPEICQPRTSTGRKEIFEFDIQYLKETHYSDTSVFLSSKITDDGIYFQLTNSNGVAVNALVKLHK